GPRDGLRAGRLRRGVRAERPQRATVRTVPVLGVLRSRGLARRPAGPQLHALALEHAGELRIDVAGVGRRAPIRAHRTPPLTGTCWSRNRAEVSNRSSASWSSVARWKLRGRRSRSTGPRTPAATMSLSVGGTVWSM